MKKLERRKLIEDLKSIDSRLKYTNLLWNDDVKSAFQESGSIDFDNLVYNAPSTSQNLVEKWKLIR